jgi:hypothetical protein
MPLSCWQDEPVLISMTPIALDRLLLQCASFETTTLSPFICFSSCWLLDAICYNRGKNFTRVLTMKLLSPVRPSKSVNRLPVH